MLSEAAQAETLADLGTLAWSPAWFHIQLRSTCHAAARVRLSRGGVQKKLSSSERGSAMGISNNLKVRPASLRKRAGELFLQSALVPPNFVPTLLVSSIFLFISQPASFGCIWSDTECI